MGQLMENPDILERKCLEIMKFASGAYYNLYAASLYRSERMRIKQLKKEVDDSLLSILGDSCSFNSSDFSYTTILYTIYYFESQLEEETFHSLVTSLLERKQPEYPYFSPIIYLLQSERKLPIDIIRRISEKIEKGGLGTQIEEHAQAPYDIRYFFLRREETPEDIKEKYLREYDFIPFDELKESLEEFMNDFNSDLQNEHITDFSQIKGNKVLEWDYHYYQVIQEYITKRVSTKEKVKNKKGTKKSN